MNTHQNENEDEHDPEASNDFSSTSFFEFTARQTSKKSNNPTLQNKLSGNLSKLNHILLTRIQILTPRKIQSQQLRKQLKRYCFKRIAKQNLSDRFGYKNQAKKDEQILIMSLLSVMNQFKNEPANHFYIVFESKNEQEVIYFSHEKYNRQNDVQSYCVLSSHSPKWRQFLSAQQIPFTQLDNQYGFRYQDSSNKPIQIVIKNQVINIVWGLLFNRLIMENKSFEIATNYPFINSFESISIEIYNGTQTKQFEKYEHIAHQQYNILGQLTKKVYRMVMEGYWSIDNLNKVTTKLNGMFGTDKYGIEYTNHRCTDGFHNINNMKN